MEKLLKLTFQSKADWEKIKSTLEYDKGVKSIIELGHMQKPPEKEGGEWGVYDDYAVDIIVSEDYDYSALTPYLVEKASEGFGHKIEGGEYEVIFKRL